MVRKQPVLWTPAWFRLQGEPKIRRIMYDIEANLMDEAVTYGLETDDWRDVEWFEDLHNRCESALWMRGSEGD